MEKRKSSLAQQMRSTFHTLDFDKSKGIVNIEHRLSRIIRELIAIETPECMITPKNPTKWNKRNPNRK